MPPGVPGMEVAGERWTGLYGTGWEGPSPAPSLPPTFDICTPLGYAGHWPAVAAMKSV